MANKAEDTEKKGAEKSETAAPAAAAAAAGGGMKAWLPLIVTLLTMPMLAYVTTSFLLIPKIKKAVGQPAGESAHAATEAAESGHAESGGGHGGGGGGHGEAAPASTGAGGKPSYPFGKVLVNVSGSQGTRYLLANFTLGGGNPNIKNKIESNKDQLTDLASSTLSTKTIADLEKPGARNMIRTELISAFNTALGGQVVQEIYFTEFAIQ